MEEGKEEEIRRSGWVIQVFIKSFFYSFISSILFPGGHSSGKFMLSFIKKGKKKFQESKGFFVSSYFFGLIFLRTFLQSIFVL